jgi:hypothetical protein
MSSMVGFFEQLAEAERNGSATPERLNEISVANHMGIVGPVPTPTSDIAWNRWPRLAHLSRPPTVIARRSIALSGGLARVRSMTAVRRDALGHVDQ